MVDPTRVRRVFDRERRRYLVRVLGGVTMPPLADSNSAPFLAGGRTFLPSISADGHVRFHANGSCVAVGDSIYIYPAGPAVYDCLQATLETGTATAASMNDNLVAVFTARSVADGTIGVYRGSSTALVPDAPCWEPR
jgi:hypothetical protein